MANGIFVAGGHLSALVKRLFWNWALTDDPKCSKCKGAMQTESTYLYLLPISFGAEHEECAGCYPYEQFREFLNRRI